MSRFCGKADGVRGVICGIPGWPLSFWRNRRSAVKYGKTLSLHLHG